MKTLVKTQAKKDVVKLSPKEVLKSVKAKKQNDVKKPNEYKIQVLDVNANFKKSLRNTGKALKLLLASDALTSTQVKFAKELQKDDAKYTSFDAKVRRTKNGDITAFYVLQAIYRAMK
jgi:hypothetical protein